MPTFTAKIEKNWIMRCVIVPVAVMRELGGGQRIQVVASYADEKIVTTVMPAGRGRGRLTVLADVVRRAGLTYGDKLEVTLEPSRDPRDPAPPEDLRRALQFHSSARSRWDGGPASQRRWIVTFIEEARRAETRVARVERVIELLTEQAQKRAARAKPRPRATESPK